MVVNVDAESMASTKKAHETNTRLRMIANNGEVLRPERLSSNLAELICPDNLK